MVVRVTKKVSSIFLSIAISLVKTIIIVPKGTCRFYPSCSEYAHEAIKRLPVFNAFIKITARIIRCNPFSIGGYDPVINEKRKG